MLVSADMCRLMAAAVFVSPFIPMLFMGEEWAEINPFLFFINHTDKKLAAIVNKGRKEEFSYFNWQGEPPDPRLEETFTGSQLQWNLLEQEPHKSMFDYYKRLIALRKSTPALCSADRNRTRAECDEANKLLRLQRWSDGQHLECIMNFSDKEQFVQWPDGKIIFSSKEHLSSNNILPESILIFEKQ
jgi:maltooligosyltrehalose trehalohydrolase